MKSKIYTVQELIDILMRLEDKENVGVEVEGCDCTGTFNGVVRVDSDRDSDPEGFTVGCFGRFKKMALIRRD